MLARMQIEHVFQFCSNIYDIKQQREQQNYTALYRVGEKVFMEKTTKN